MSETMTFRNLENQLGISTSNAEPNSPLQSWYDSIRDKPIHAFSDEDLCKACRQELFLEFVVPITIDRLSANPLAGEMYDGELLAALASVTSEFWSKHKSVSLKVSEFCKSIQLPAATDEDIVRDWKNLSEHVSK